MHATEKKVMRETADEKIARYLGNLAAELAQDGWSAPNAFTALFKDGEFVGALPLYAAWIEPKQ